MLADDIINMDVNQFEQFISNITDSARDELTNEIFKKLQYHSTLRTYEEKCYNKKITPSELGKLKFIIRMNCPSGLENDDGGFVDYMYWKHGIFCEKKDNRLRQDD